MATGKWNSRGKTKECLTFSPIWSPTSEWRRSGMKNNPSAAITAAKIMPSTAPAAPSIALETGPRNAWTRFWFTAVDPIGLHALRLIAGLLFIAWLLPLGGHLEAFFGMAG